ncbi:hypothetical protein N658DRAFT_561265, partial [Parathielavia hyrcaniae]
MAQRGRDGRAMRNGIISDRAVGVTSHQTGPPAEHDGRTQRESPPATGAGASQEQTAGREDAETKKLLEEFRNLVMPALWERVQTAARAYYSKIFTVGNTPCSSDAQELRRSLERLERKVDKLAGANTAATDSKTWAQVAGMGAGSATPAREQRVQRVPKKLFRELIVDTGDAGPDITERSPRDTVTAVNMAAGPTGPKGAIAAKKLPK